MEGCGDNSSRQDEKSLSNVADDDIDDDWENDMDNDQLADIDLSEEGLKNLVAKESDKKQEKDITTKREGILSLCEVFPDDRTPLDRLRRGYLWVSDMVSQNWCEHQMIYRLALPKVVEESQAMAAGTNLHLARELQVEDYVQVTVTSNEDIFAVKVINLITTCMRLLTGAAVCREIPIFGAPFKQDIFFMGCIDEIRCDINSRQLELVELKTRTYKSLPSAAQRNSHKIQTMIYKKLFDDLVKGNLTKETIARTLNLDLFKPLGTSILEQMLKVDTEPRKDLDALLQCLFDKIQCLTCIRGILLEYCYQEDGSTIGLDQVEYDETWFKPIFDNYSMFWKGRRSACGVEIEDAWKCQRCEFADVCEWREKKSKEYADRNSAVK